MPVEEVVNRLGSDHRCVVLRGVTTTATHLAVPGNEMVETYTQSGLDLVLVNTHHQFGPFEVTLAAHDTACPPADDVVEDVFEFSAVVDGPMSVGELVDGAVAEVGGLHGSVRLRVSARAEHADSHEPPIEHGDVDAVPREHYQIDVWPAPASAARVVRGCGRHGGTGSVWPSESAATDAARRILSDVLGRPDSPPISGPLADLEVDIVLPGTARKVFNRVAGACGWPFVETINGSAHPTDDTYYEMGPPDEAAAASRWIRCRLLEAPSRNRVTMAWNVVRERRHHLSRGIPVMAEDSIVTLQVTTAVTAGDPLSADVRLHQRGVPAAWTQDLGVLWEATLRALASRAL